MKQRLMLITLAFVFAFSASGCSTVTVIKKGDSRTSSQPDYEDSKSYYIWGLVGQQHAEVGQICRGDSADQIVFQSTFLDSFLTIITLGIYSPRSLKVWCGNSRGGRTS